MKEVSHGQTERFIKSTVEEWVKDFSKENANYSEQIYNIWVMKSLFKIKKYV